MKKNITKYSLLFLFIGFLSCETTNLDLLSNPNDVTQDNLDPDFLFNQIQLDYAQFLESAMNPAEQLTRQAYLGGPTYDAAYAPISFNGIWFQAYGATLTDIQALEPIVLDRGQTYHLGVSKIMKAHILMTLVDLFGNVPYSEALLGTENLNPGVDSGSDVYIAALAELDAGIALLGEAPTLYPPIDLYYGGGSVGEGSAANWITAGKSLKFRALSTLRLNGSAVGLDIASEMTTLINEDDLINTADQDFVLQYGGNRANPNTRHPDYNNAYENGGGRYMSNYFMWQLSDEKGFDDPRLSYYFYRQDIDATDETDFTLGCPAQPTPPHYSNFTSIYVDGVTVPFCVTDINRGYWGRDYGDGSGIPPDGEKRTQVGIYPAGGKYDEGAGGDTQNGGTDGQLGAGITPIILSSFIDFMKAEAALTIGTPGDPAVLLESGIRSQMDKVIGFLGEEGSATAADVDAYVAFVLDAYNAADANGKLDIIMKEYHIASWGNGLDAYNGYRRTGFPSNLQPMLEPVQGDFYNSLLYPNSFLETNSSAVEKSRTERIFWDTNSFNLN